MANRYSGAGGGAGAMAVVKGDMGGGPHHRARIDAGAYSTREVVRRLFAYVRPHLALFVVSFVASTASVVLQLWVPIIVGQAIDAMVGAGAIDVAGLRHALARLAWVVPVAALLQWAGGSATTRLALTTVRDLREDACATLKDLPISFLDAHPAGDLLSRVVNDADAVGDGLLQGFTQLFQGIVAIVGSLAFMCSLSVGVCLVVVVLTPVPIAVAARIARMSSASFADAQRLTGELSGYVNEMVTNQKLVEAFGQGERATGRFREIDADLYVAGDRSQFVSSLSNPTTRLVNNFTYAVVAVVGALSVITSFPSPLTVGQVQSFLAYANQYMKPFNEISGVVTQLEAALASARRLLALLDAERMEEPADAAPLPKPVTGDIEFSHVDFSYDGTRKVLDDVSFHARPGQRFALVGATGCGKTTLINVLMRFYDADAGTIRVDGQDTATVSRRDLREDFGMVLQETWLKSATIRDNIAYGRPDATDDEVVEAARQAHAHKFIMQLPKGYDTVVDEAGSTLSQGQRQLVSIARVMLMDPAILLLDEATSSIDTRTELQVQDAFDRMMAGRTSLVVAHRLSTVVAADCILVMDAGAIVERGTHEELLERGGAYARLYQSQWEA